MGMPGNYFSVGTDNPKVKKSNKASRSRLKTVDSKGKLMTPKNSKTVQENQTNNGMLNDTFENPSSGKKKKSSSKKMNKNKASPKSKQHCETTNRMNFNSKSKEFHNRVKFHPLSKDPSTAFIRNSMNF